MIDRRAWRFFYANAGYVVGRRAMGAADLARAEHHASGAGWQYDWQWDEWSAADGCQDAISCDKRGAHEHEVLTCVLKDATGQVLEALGGIWDADRDLARVIEAELASEALFTLQRQWGATIHAR
jgi:hypothetical protein